MASPCDCAYETNTYPSGLVIVDCDETESEPTLPAASETVNPLGRPSFERPANNYFEARKLIAELSSTIFWLERSSAVADGDGVVGAT